MISAKMTEALNQQINKELYSAYLYQSMASYANLVGLKGAANWFAVQAKEELGHAMKFYGYINSQGEHTKLAAIAGPQVEFGSLKAMFELTLKHEKTITASIHALADLAAKDKDYATGILLQWFISEQIEEEENAREIIGKLEMAGDKGGGLYIIDRELSARGKG